MSDLHVTEAIAAHRLTPGRVLLVPMTEAIETVARIDHAHGYVTVATAEGSLFQWSAETDVDVMT